jgi:hypothetical protein
LANLETPPYQQHWGLGDIREQQEDTHQVVKPTDVVLEGHRILAEGRHMVVAESPWEADVVGTVAVAAAGSTGCIAVGRRSPWERQLTQAVGSNLQRREEWPQAEHLQLCGQRFAPGSVRVSVRYSQTSYLP